MRRVVEGHMWEGAVGLGITTIHGSSHNVASYRSNWRWQGEAGAVFGEPFCI